MRPGLGEDDPPPRAAILLLLFEWFRIYFGSGVVKLASGDPQWRHLTALDHYYEYGPLPTWIGYYVQHLPHGFHAFSCFLVLAIELTLPWLAFAGRRARLATFCLLTPFQLLIIATANYTFLNWLVLFLGVWLLDDEALSRVPLRARPIEAKPRSLAFRRFAAVVLGVEATAAVILTPPFPAALLPSPVFFPVRVLEQLRLVDRYGLFARMTDPRYEIEFQGSSDGVTWTPWPFRFKPQAVDEAPGIYAPWHPRFEWNLWFASLDDDWTHDRWVMRVEEKLLEGQPDVLRLFRRDPFAGHAPRYVRAMKWQYWFTDLATKRATGAWWRREERGLYCPALERRDDGTIVPASL